MCGPFGLCACAKKRSKTQARSQTQQGESFAAKAFDHTGRYDELIAETLSSSRFDASEPEAPRYLHLSYERAYPLRYGENPQQPGAFYLDPRSALGSLARAESLGTGAKELSYNNLLDADAAHRIANAFQTPAATIIKHRTLAGQVLEKTSLKRFEMRVKLIR